MLSRLHRAWLLTHAAALCLTAAGACGRASEVEPTDECPPRPAGCPSCGDVLAGTDGACPAAICYQNPAPPARCQPWADVNSCGRARCWGEADCGHGSTFEAPRTAACEACLERACDEALVACEDAP
jgi:hypothetical protein